MTSFDTSDDEFVYNTTTILTKDEEHWLLYMCDFIHLQDKPEIIKCVQTLRSYFIADKVDECMTFLPSFQTQINRTIDIQWIHCIQWMLMSCCKHAAVKCLSSLLDSESIKPYFISIKYVVCEYALHKKSYDCFVLLASSGIHNSTFITNKVLRLSMKQANVELFQKCVDVGLKFTAACVEPLIETLCEQKATSFDLLDKLVEHLQSHSIFSWSSIELSDIIKHNRADFLRHILERDANKNNVHDGWGGWQCENCCKHGALDCLKVFEDFGARMDVNECMLECIRNNQLECLKHCCSYQSALNDILNNENIQTVLVNEAVDSNADDVFTYLVDTLHFEINQETLYSIAIQGSLMMMKLALQQIQEEKSTSTLELDRYVMANAVQSDNLELVQYLRKMGCVWDHLSTCAASEHSSSVEMLQYLHSNGCPWTWDCSSAAAENHKLDCLQYATDHGCEVDYDALFEAVNNNSYECLAYLLYHPTLDILQKVWDTAEKDDKTSNESDENNVSDDESDDEECLKGRDSVLSDMLQIACQNNHTQSVCVLLQYADYKNATLGWSDEFVKFCCSQNALNSLVLMYEWSTIKFGESDDQALLTWICELIHEEEFDNLACKNKYDIEPQGQQPAFVPSNYLPMNAFIYKSPLAQFVDRCKWKLQKSLQTIKQSECEILLEKVEKAISDFLTNVFQPIVQELQQCSSLCDDVLNKVFKLYL